MKDEDYDLIANEIRRTWFKTTKNIILEDMVTKFDRTDSLNKDAIKQFCIDFSYLPPKIKNKSFFECFIREQGKVKRILKLIANKNLKVKDLQYINKRMSHLHPTLKAVTKKKLFKINQEFRATDSLDKLESTSHAIFTYSGPEREFLWLSISQHIQQKTPIRECQNCGNFFTVSDSKTNRSYCDDTCKNQYAQKKHRYKVKKLNLNRNKP